MTERKTVTAVGGWRSRWRRLWQRGWGCNNDNNDCILQSVEEEHCCADLFAVFAIVLLLSLRWPLCSCCSGDVTIVVQVPLLSLHWRSCPCCHWCAGVVVIVALASSHCCAGVVTHCHKPPRYVPYKCTYVPYTGTFGASDQGQTLDVWGWHTADVNAEEAGTPDVTTSSRKDTLNITRYLHRNQCWSIRSYGLDPRMDPVQRLLCTLTPV